jgi:DNA-binding NarL/FixJ family response regulator
MTSEVRVAIIEDQPRIRDGLRMLIDGTAGYCCTGAYASMEEALPRIGGELPEVVLVDIGLPGMSGIDGICRMKELWPDLPLVVLTIYGDDKRIFDALCAGARGYLLKNTPPVRLLESIREIMGGGAPMSPEVARRVVDLFQQIHPSVPDHDLTPHEMRLLKLLVEGHNYQTAGAELKVSINTIRFHMRSVYSKLQVHSKAEAVSKALRSRIIR